MFESVDLKDGHSTTGFAVSPRNLTAQSSTCFDQHRSHNQQIVSVQHHCQRRL